MESFTLRRTNLGEGKSIHVFENRITFLLTPFGGQDPQIVINPNITLHEEEVVSETIDSQNVIETNIVERTSFSLSDLLRAGGGYLALTNYEPHQITVGGINLQVTLQAKREIGPYDMEVDLLVEDVSPNPVNS